MESFTSKRMDMKARKLTIMQTYKFKLYSNHGNRELQKTIDSHAEVWNHFVALCRRYYAIYGKYPGKKPLMRHLTQLKRLSRYTPGIYCQVNRCKTSYKGLIKRMRKCSPTAKAASVRDFHDSSNGSDTSPIPSNKRVGNC